MNYLETRTITCLQRMIVQVERCAQFHADPAPLQALADEARNIVEHMEVSRAVHSL